MTFWKIWKIIWKMWRFFFLAFNGLQTTKSLTPPI
jgi:hypothetical protein